MYIIDKEAFRAALRRKGHKSLGKFAQELGVHRNTIYHYLSGNAVFPTGLEKMLIALELEPQDIIQKKQAPKHQLKPLENLIENLQNAFPHVSFILFGSRAQGRARNYSDWDIGVYSRNDIPYKEYRNMLHMVDDLSEDLPFFVDLVLLNRADENFLREAAKKWIFLGGHLSDWIALNERHEHE